MGVMRWLATFSRGKVETLKPILAAVANPSESPRTYTEVLGMERLSPADYRNQLRSDPFTRFEMWFETEGDELTAFSIWAAEVERLKTEDSTALTSSS